MAALVLALCISGCGIDSEADLVKAVIEERNLPEGSSGEVIYREQRGDYEKMMLLFHGDTYLGDRVCMAEVGYGITGNITGPWLVSLSALLRLDEGFIEYISGRYYLLVVTAPEAARITLTDSHGYGPRRKSPRCRLCMKFPKHIAASMSAVCWTPAGTYCMNADEQGPDFPGLSACS